METSEFEANKALILDLKSRLADADVKIIEGEKVSKKLNSTILELKGNIRVFCRVRPLLSDGGVRNDDKGVSFPTSMEAQVRGNDLSQDENGSTCPRSAESDRPCW